MSLQFPFAIALLLILPKGVEGFKQGRVTGHGKERRRPAGAARLAVLLKQLVKRF
jgi:hypothetical protein